MLSLAALRALPWKWIAVAVGVLIACMAAVASLYQYGDSRYRSGQQDERAVWEQLVADQQLEMAYLQRQADQLLAAQRSEDEGRIETERKELEDAVANIPDQSTTARQRARACSILRRQGTASAACVDQPTP